VTDLRFYRVKCKELEAEVARLRELTEHRGKSLVQQLDATLAETRAHEATKAACAYAESRLAHWVDRAQAAESERDTARADLEELRAACEHYKRATGEARAERDTARAELKALTAPLQEGESWTRLTYDEGYRDGVASLQAKVARAVALLENHVLPLCSEEGDIEHAVKQTLEALR
jgi:chromosome segregation ATPase